MIYACALDLNQFQIGCTDLQLLTLKVPGEQNTRSHHRLFKSCAVLPKRYLELSRNGRMARNRRIESLLSNFKDFAKRC